MAQSHANEPRALLDDIAIARPPKGCRGDDEHYVYAIAL
jgi:hypothetical protein